MAANLEDRIKAFIAAYEKADKTRDLQVKAIAEVELAPGNKDYEYYHNRCQPHVMEFIRERKRIGLGIMDELLSLLSDKWDLKNDIQKAKQTLLASYDKEIADLEKFYKEKEEYYQKLKDQN